VQSFKLVCIVQFKKKYKLLTYDLLRFVSHVHDDVHDDDVRGLLIFCTVLLSLWFLSLNKWKQQKQMFVAEVFRTTMMYFESLIHRAMAVAFCMARDAGAAFITKNWVAAQLKRSAHYVQRNWHRSPHDLQTEFHGFRPLVLSQESRDIVGQSADRQRNSLRMLCCCCCWRPHGLLICNFWFFLNWTIHISLKLCTVL